MLQILGLRDYTAKDGRISKKHAFFEQQWRANDINDLFHNIDTFIEKIPEHERYNIFFTVAHCTEKEPRAFDYGELVVIDIDGIDLLKIEETISCVLRACNISYNRTGILCSGNGLQFFIKVSRYDLSYFLEKKEYYKLMSLKINSELQKSGLSGKTDTTVFESRRLMRMPNTINKKKDREDKRAYLIQPHVDFQDFSFAKAIGIEEVGLRDQISLVAYKKYPTPDSETVQKECEFLKHCKNNQSEVSEPEWYAMLSIVGRLKDGKQLIHEYSKHHPGYDQDSTTKKGEQALVVSGPRTCKNIDNLWGKCHGCKHYGGDIASPIVIQGDDYIRTESTGFYDVIVTQTGKVSKKPNYDDLLKFFKKTYEYFTDNVNQRVYTYNKIHWQEMPEADVAEFAEQNFKPSPTSAMRSEFVAKVKVHNLKKEEVLRTNTTGFINLQNGVLNLSTGELLEHSEKYFFTGVLPYAYDAKATAPKFMQFMRDITLNRPELVAVLLEFVGYAICHHQDCKMAKALIMHGTGANGKSTFMEIVKALIGNELYSTVSLGRIADPRYTIDLMGKIVNIGEETDVHALNNHENFKTIVTGGDVEVHRYYENPFSMRCTTKLMFACNKLPYTRDDSDGLYRRLLLVPFDAKFSGDRDNKDIKKDLLNELPGILNIIIDSYKRLIERGRFDEGAILMQELKEFKNDNDTILSWYMEEVEETGNEKHFISRHALFEAFLQYCEEANIPKNLYAFSRTSFLKHINSIRSAKVKDKQVSTGRVSSKERGYSGMRLINEAMY